MSNLAKIIIGADVVPTKSNEELFISGDAEALIGSELKKVLEEADYRIFNLEVPLTDKETPIKKCGPNLIAPTKAIKGYKALGVDLLTLANNHILDEAEQGLYTTCRVLKDNKIDYLGVGKDPKEAAEPYVFMLDGKKIGVYACAETEFSIVSDKSAGANPFDPLESPDHIARLKSECDFVIVLYHGGKEHYRYPSPYLQKVCRKIADKGADLIICQHSHCIGCEEKYGSSTIVYGQGNFIFDGSSAECWQTGLLVCLDGDFKVSYIPVVKDANKVRLAKDYKASEILAEFEARSNEIKDPGTVQNKYEEFSKTMLEHYLTVLSGINRSFLFRVFNKLSGYRLIKLAIKRRFTETKKLAVKNAIECEAHRELLLCGLTEHDRELSDKERNGNAK